MYQVCVTEAEIDWVELELPGVSMKVLCKDEITGAMTVLTRLQAGATIPAHWHTLANETVFVVEGDFIEDGASFKNLSENPMRRRELLAQIKFSDRF